jgi:hypothetical protein
MSKQYKGDTKAQKASANFEHPHEVIVDSSLSPSQKVRALDTLEREARQLAEASSEGMGGGERNKLHDVLVAKDMLALPPMSAAYEAILQDLRAWQRSDTGIASQTLLEEAISALERLKTLLPERPAQSTGAIEGLNSSG